MSWYIGNVISIRDDGHDSIDIAVETSMKLQKWQILSYKFRIKRSKNSSNGGISLQLNTFRLLQQKINSDVDIGHTKVDLSARFP